MSKDLEIVATFVAAAGAPLTQDVLNEAMALSEKSGATVKHTQWLEFEKAADVFLTGAEAVKLQMQFNVQLQDHPLDVIVQPTATRRKRLLVADMESTMIEQEMLDELAADLGFGEEMAAITRRSMNGEIDFATSLRERVKSLKDVPVTALAHAAQRITFIPGAEALLAGIKKQGVKSWLVTGGFTYFAEPVARQLGFDRCYANELVMRDGSLSGELVEPILDRNGKKTYLEKASAELDVALSHALAIGDGANDIAMLSACNEGGGLGVAYHAKPAVRAVVPHQINRGDLSVLLYAQGYKI